MTLGDYDEENDTYEIKDGLKASDYIVWPSEDCKSGAPVMKNDGSGSGMMNGGDDGMIDNGMLEELPEDSADDGEILPDSDPGDNQAEIIGGGDEAAPSEEVSGQ